MARPAIAHAGSSTAVLHNLAVGRGELLLHGHVDTVIYIYIYLEAHKGLRKELELGKARASFWSTDHYIFLCALGGSPL